MIMDIQQSLPQAFMPENGTATAGNSKGINEGSTGMLIMSADKANCLQPIARIKSVTPGWMPSLGRGLDSGPGGRNLLGSSLGLAIFCGRGGVSMLCYRVL